LLTDGFLEWAGPSGEQFGTQRLKDAIREAKDRSPAELISYLHERVLRFVDHAEQDDDLTAVVIKRTT